MTLTNLAWTGGDISAGHTDYKPGEPPHLDLFKAVAPTCNVLLTVTDDLRYQDVISVMDSIVKLGLVNVRLGKAADTTMPEQPSARPQPNIDMKWVKGVDGKLTLQGTVDKMSGTTIDKNVPTVVITKTAVSFKGEEVGRPDDATLDVELAAKLPAKPKDPMLIIQADGTTSAGVINRVIAAASKQGYSELLFAVKNK